MAILSDPLPVPALRALRAEVLRLRQTSPTKLFAPRLNLGVPGGRCVRMETPPGLDDGLRRDLIHALFRRYDAGGVAPAVWLGRPGHPTPHDEDLAWLGAALGSYGELGVPLTLVVVTRTGWYDPRSNVGRTWRRPRDRSRAA